MSEFLKLATGYFNGSNAVSQSNNHYPPTASSSASVATNTTTTTTTTTTNNQHHSAGQARELAAAHLSNGGGHGLLTDSRGGDQMPSSSSRRSDTTWLSNEDFSGQLVELAGLKLRVKDTIAIGGFAYVFRVEDIHTHKDYALKRLISVEKDTSKAIEMEIEIHRCLKNHPNIVDLMDSVAYQAYISNDLKRTEFLLLMEYCSGGSLVDYLMMAADVPLEASEILKIFYQAVCAVAHLHGQNPPISHRDIKIENFLIDSKRQLKLCDFGSASRDVYRPNLDWNARQHNSLEEKLCDVTTPMYRAPEMLDTWSNHEIGTKVDVWALGCVLYVLCFQKHPFQDAGKLRIINGNYTLSAESNYQIFHPIIKGCLTVNPADRFDISTLLEHLAVISETMKWPLRGELLLKKSHQRKNSRNSSSSISSQQQQQQQQQPQSTKMIGENGGGGGGGGAGNLEMGRSVFYDKSSSTTSSSSGCGGGMEATTTSAAAGGVSGGGGGGTTNLLSSIKGGAGNFLRNLKDTSSKMMQSVQQSITRTDIDVSYITSRLLVMPSPSEGLESTYKSNNIDDVRHYVETHFAPHKVSVYNFGMKNGPRLPPPIRTVDVGSVWTVAQGHAPLLHNLYSLAEDMYGFLTADSKSVVIIQSPDGGGCTSALFVCALLMYADLTRQPEDAVQVFAVKRHPVNLRASEFRYLYYLGDLLRSPPLHPHLKNVQLLSLTCQPVPRMTRARDGCRLYVEIYANDHFVLSTLPDDYDKLPLYLAGPGTIKIPLQTNVSGDLLVILYHARKTMVRPHGVKICQFQIHTGFVPEQETLLTFSVMDLDDVPDVDCVPSNFKVSLSLAVRGARISSPIRNPPWTMHHHRRRSGNGAQNLFSSQLEHQEMSDNFVTKSFPENNVNRSNNNNNNNNEPVSSSSTSSNVSIASLPSPPTSSMRLNATPRISRRRRTPPELVDIANPTLRDEPLLNVGNQHEEEGHHHHPITSRRRDNNNTPLIMPDITSIQPEVLMVPSDTPARVDLLNLHHHNQPHPNPPPPHPPRPPHINATVPTNASFDLLGVFGEDPHQPSNNPLIGSNGPIPDILSSSHTQPQAFQSTANLDDILGPLNLNSSEPAMDVLHPHAFSSSVPPPPTTISSIGSNSRFRITNGLTGVSSSTSSPSTSSEKNNDPFADLANFSASLNLNLGGGGNKLKGGDAGSINRPKPMRMATGTSGSGGGGVVGGGGLQSSNSMNIFTSNSGTSSIRSNTADYNRSHFANLNTTSTSSNNGGGNNNNSNNSNTTTPNSTAAAAAAGGGGGGNTTGSGFGDVFADILDEQGYKFSQKAHQSPRSINDMRKVERIKDMDPNQALILEWTDGKKNNIRALLCTLHVVLWPNAKWTKCEMSQIISPADVKKYYRKACLAVHPDKNSGTENEEVAKLIFMELNYAWNEFEKDSTQQNLFMQ